MAVMTMRERVATIPYQAGAAVTHEMLVSQRYVWNLYCSLYGKYEVTANSGTAAGVGPGRLLDLRLNLNNSRILQAGHWYSITRPRGVLNYLTSEESDLPVAEGVKEIWGYCKLPIACSWSRRPHETIIDMADESRLDLTVIWGTIASVINGGTVEWDTEPTVTVIAETSETAPPGAAVGYWVQREREVTGLGSNPLPDYTLDLPVGPDHNYTGLVVALYNDDAQGTMREPRASFPSAGPNDPEYRLEFRGPSGHRTPWGPINEGEAFFTHKFSTRHPDRFSDDLGTVSKMGYGLAPVSFMAPQAGGLVSQALQTGDASALTLHCDLPGFDDDGAMIVSYDVYQPKLR
jgi:hypothetical protein